MMNFKKLISLFLAVLMLCGVLAGLPVMTASAEEVAEETTSPDETTGEVVIPSTPEEIQEHYYTTVYSTPEEKLATMKKMTEKFNFAIYADEQSGEVAIKNTVTGQILFTNPYDIGTSNATDDVKKELMSQIIVNYGDVTKENSLYFHSFDQAAIKNQITVRNIKNGIRVEYTIGRAEARFLLPEVISKENFEERILKPMEESYGMTIEEAKVIAKDWGNPLADAAHEFNQTYSYYMLQDLDACELDAMKEAMLNSFPITEKMDVYVLDSKTPENVKAKLEQRIKEHCPDYSFEQLDEDHMITEHVSSSANPPLFKMALEYTLTEDGFSVRLPANGIRFNESAFKLHGIEILPFLGAGNISYDGYSFMPDGSGTLFSFEDMRDVNNVIVTPKVYGEDYAYHKLTATYQQATRYPVYGVVENTRYYDCLVVNDVTGEEEIISISGVIYDMIKEAREEGKTLDKKYSSYEKTLNSASQITERIEDRGFMAVVEEGDALASLEFHHEGSKHKYDGISIICNPRPSDEFNLADAISVGANATVTRTTERKYVGNYKMHFVMLTDETVGAKATEAGALQADEWYEASWLGMAFAYRDFLTNKGVLTPLTSENVSKDIPLYIESFGAMETIEKILSIPMEVTRPLTSAKDILTMYEELSKDKDGNELITNINFKLTGYANGGMYATIPYGLKWEKAVSKDVSMQELFNEAAKIDGLSLFPDFDFTYVTTTDTFDGFSLRKHAVRTIDDRYAYKREYMATQQRYAGYFQLAVSPAYFSRFYEKLMDKYLAYDNVTGISVSTFGNSLNSDFDEDEPYNREDSKGFVKQALAFISGANNNTMEVMVDGGNAYTWEYVDHILGAPLDSSRYIQASYSVPFLGVVLHGNMNFTGAPLNMEGDVNYAKLKAIENGASIYFTLSYQNTQNLKEDYNLSKYYSVRYDIWYDDVIEIYTELNDVLADVQTMPIVDHQFLSGMRVPDTDELDRDLSAEFDAIMDFQGNQQAFLDQMKADSVADARKLVSQLAGDVIEHLNSALTKYRGQAGAALKYIETNGDYFAENFSDYMNVKLRYDAVMADPDATEEEKEAVSDSLTTVRKALDRAIRAVAAQQVGIRTSTGEIATLIENAELARELINQTEGRPQSIVDEVDATIAATKAELQEMMGTSYEYSIGNLEVSTFLYLHYAYLNYMAGEETPAGRDSLETMYKLFSDDRYGIYAEEVDFLRYLAANREMTDEEIIAKYNLKAGQPSKDALAQYVLELLGASYEFDPVLESNGGAEKAIVEFFKNTFGYDLKTGYRDIGKDNGDFLDFFPINDKRSSDGKSNAKAITSLREKIVAEINAKLVKPMTPTADGSYDLDTMYTTLGITEDELVASIKTLIETAMAVKVDTQKNEYPIEYLTVETMEADIRNYIRTFYYFSVMDKTITKDIGESTLPVLLTNSQTSSSMDLLASLRIETFGPIAAESKYQTLLTKYLADKANADVAIADILANITPYGDRTADLNYAYFVAFAKAAVGGDKLANYDLENVTRKEEVDGKEVTYKLREEAKALMAEKLPGIAYGAGLDQLVAELVLLEAKYELKAPEEALNKATAYVYFSYFDYTAKKTDTLSFYYDDDIAEMDAAILNEVEKKKAIIASKLGADADAFDFYEAVLDILAETNPDTGKSLVYEFVEDVVAKVDLAPDSNKGTTKDYVLRLYNYRLLNCMPEYAMGVLTDLELSIDKDSDDLRESAIKNIYKYIGEDLPELIKAARANVTVRGNMPNYGMESFMTEEEINAMLDDIIDRQLIKLSFVDNDPDRDLLRPQVLKIVKFALYEKVTKDRLVADKAPTFPFYETYAGSLEDADAALYDLMSFHTLTYTNVTEAEFENFYKVVGGLIEDEEVEETSRYLSDDGRIVSVSYGQKNANGTYDKYKTFVLNYNNFSVNVVYEGITYTIPAYGYVVVMHDNP